MSDTRNIIYFVLHMGFIFDFITIHQIILWLFQLQHILCCLNGTHMRKYILIPQT